LITLKTSYHATEEVMLFDFEGSCRTQPFKRVLGQQRRDDVLRLGRHGPVILLRPLDIVVDRVGEELFRGVSEEGDASNQKLVQDDAHAPPVDRLAVALPQDYFWCDVFGSSKHLEQEF